MLWAFQKKERARIIAALDKFQGNNGLYLAEQPSDMELSKKRRNQIFWILQFLGWGFINSIAAFVPKGISMELTIYSVVVGTFIGILPTSILRWYLKRNVHLDSFGPKDILKILASLTLTALVFGLLNMFFGFLYGKFGPALTENEIHMFKSYNNFWIQVVNSLFLVGAWMVTYLVITLLLKLNQDRIERLELNTNLKQAQLNTLKGQINPHFMFNSLNNIRGLMLEDVEKSREMLTKLSEILRYSLTKNNTNDIAVREELEVVDNYIDLSKIQFEDRLEFVKKVDTDTLDLRIPPMVIQLLVENATKHGIANLKNGGRILLKILQKEDHLLIEVRNTGQLNISKDSTQLGLKNIKQRLKLLYGDWASFTLEEVTDEVVAQISIPLT
ncbi:Histidine kinase [Flagellimonas taeanensis]|uniref:Histidine kinase n=2 Tax=Flagellimonas taeanensis TaxID=1005926 RepID=A0A1M6YTA6_9FLAO|nr:Histidine kinase [Allomuricauda taeanensis]SHL21370.1 Histidine kinase [Allomuricauda taeanensis]